MNFIFNRSSFFLIKTFLIRDIQSRYKGSYFGLAWNILTPVMMLLVFSFVFQEIFQAKWPASDDGLNINFTYNLFIGLSVFWLYADVLGKAPGVFSSSPNYIKKVIFPLEILVLTLVLSSLFYFAINLSIILVFSFILGIDIFPSIFFLGFVIGVSIPFLYGVALLLATLGVYIKDIGVVIGVILNLLMFLSPIFYPLSAIPEHLQFLFHMNPLTLIIEELRAILVYNSLPDILSLFYYLLVALFVFFLSKKIYKPLQRGFADVI